MTDFEETQEDKGPKDKQQEKAALNKITGYSEDQDTLANVDLNTISRIEAERSKLNQAQEEELAKVVISKQDVVLIVDQMEVPFEKAENVLRRNNGNVVKALVSLLS